MQKQVEVWRETEFSNVAAKVIAYEAFIEGELDVPKHLARRVHEFYFNPAVRRLQGADALELVQCAYVSIQGTGAIAGYRPGDHPRPLTKSPGYSITF